MGSNLINPQLSRRSFLAAAGIAGFALTACESNPNVTLPQDISDQDKEVRMVSWPNYIDFAKDANGEPKLDKNGNLIIPTLELFKKQTGITPTYLDSVEDNESYISSVRSKLTQGEDIGADVVVLTDWMAEQLHQEGMLVDYVNDIPGSDIRINPALDKFYQRKSYALPYRSGYVGLAWDAELLPQVTNGKLKRLTRVSDLWIPELAGRVGVLSEMPDTMGLLMKEAGVNVQDTNSIKSNWDKNLKYLESKFVNGQIRLAQGNYYVQDLENGVIVATMAWYGDLVSLWKQDEARNRKKYQFAFPQVGGITFLDTFVVPHTTPHLRNARELVKFYYKPEVEAMMLYDVQYIPPVDSKKAYEEYRKTANKNEKLFLPATVFPDKQFQAKLDKFALLDVATNQKFRDQFKAVIGA